MMKPKRSSTESKRFIVTGGSQGIGRATVEALLAEGHEVATFARRQEGLNRLVADMADLGYTNLHTRAVDLGDLEAIRELLRELPWMDTGLDGLVCNAAYQKLGHAMTMDPEAIEQTFRINVLSPIVTMQTCYAALKQNQGAIVYVGSISDFNYVPEYAVYGGSKAFMNSFVKHACKDTGPDGVRINVVSPGATDTPMLRSLIDRLGENASADIDEMIPVGRVGRSEEVAEAILFALNGPDFLHGDDVRIHGGIS